MHIATETPILPTRAQPIKRKSAVDVLEGRVQKHFKTTTPASSESTLVDRALMPLTRVYQPGQPALASQGGQPSFISPPPTSTCHPIHDERTTRFTPPPSETPSEVSLGQGIFSNGLGIPLSFHVLCDRPPRRKIEMLIRVRPSPHMIRKKIEAELRNWAKESYWVSMRPPSWLLGANQDQERQTHPSFERLESRRQDANLEL